MICSNGNILRFPFGVKGSILGQLKPSFEQAFQDEITVLRLAQVVGLVPQLKSQAERALA
jgi:hypothetical protein